MMVRHMVNGKSHQSSILFIWLPLKAHVYDFHLQYVLVGHSVVFVTHTCRIKTFRDESVV